MVQRYIPVALRRLVRERAGERCEYCLMSEQLTLAAHWVDHIVAEKHGGRTAEANLALSCVLYNQHKGMTWRRKIRSRLTGEETQGEQPLAL